MNLVQGIIIDDAQEVVESLKERIEHTLSNYTLDVDLVINACDRLLKELDIQSYYSLLEPMQVSKKRFDYLLDQAKEHFCANNLRLRIDKELNPKSLDPLIEKRLPLGVLFHIAAGNMDGLPAFSVLEGLITGNINILKLPSEEGGISIKILQDLIKIESQLKDMIYVFDYSSKDLVNIRKIIDVSDGVVIWGGDAAISSLRSLIPPNTKIIEWGHKNSFSYVTKNGVSKDRLEQIALNIVETNQLLCSSCQGIYLDTDDEAELFEFCEQFLPILQTVRDKYDLTEISQIAQSTLQVYTADLEAAYTNHRVYKGIKCSIIAYLDSELQTSIQFGNTWVKRLPRSQIITTLHKHKNHLQTVGLVCAEGEKEEISTLLFKTGVVRVCLPKRMSETYIGAHHDGMHPLQLYTKVVTLE